MVTINKNDNLVITFEGVKGENYAYFLRSMVDVIENCITSDGFRDSMPMTLESTPAYTSYLLHALKDMLPSEEHAEVMFLPPSEWSLSTLNFMKQPKA